MSEEREKLGGRVAVSRDGAQVFLYADTEDLARDADGIVRAPGALSRRYSQWCLPGWNAGEMGRASTVPLSTAPLRVPRPESRKAKVTFVGTRDCS